MRLCMFHPVDHPMERGWPGRVEDERVVQLAAQTLQSFFTGGGSAREHAVFPLADVRFLAPVLHPPAVRLFEDETTFAFANPAAIVHPGAEIPCNEKLQGLVLAPRIACLVGADGAIAGFTLLAEWRDPARRPPKDRDFALGLGPLVVTDEPGAIRVGREQLRADGFDWEAARDLAAERTRLYPGDLLAGPAVGEVEVGPGEVELEADGIGVLEHVVVA